MRNLNGIAEFSPPAAVPVLVEDKTVIFDSVAINGVRERSRGAAYCFQPNISKRLGRDRSWLGNMLDFRACAPRFRLKARYDAWEQQLHASGGGHITRRHCLGTFGNAPDQSCQRYVALAGHGATRLCSSLTAMAKLVSS